MVRRLAVAFVCALLTPAAFAAVGAWDGKYKMDTDKSQLTGDSFTYRRSADGMWQMIEGKEVYRFVPDGKAYPMQDAEHTQTVTMQGDHALTIVIQTKGETRATVHETLSADGRTLTDVTTATGKDGSTFESTAVSARTGAGTDFFAKWTTTKVVERTSSDKELLLAISTAADGVMTLSYAEGEATVIGKPDGTPIPWTGTEPAPGRTLSLKTVSPRRIDFVNRSDERVTTVGYFALSEDGKTLDDVYWSPDEPEVRQTKVYVRQ